MTVQLPIRTFINRRLVVLSIGYAELARRCRFKNIAKGIRRIEEVCMGEFTSPGAKAVILSLPPALEIRPTDVEKAVEETIDILNRINAEEATERTIAWRETFKPSAYLVGTESKPSSITMYGLSGGAERWLKIHLDVSKPPITFASQALTVVRSTPTVPFFGATKGFIVNYAPDRAVRFDNTGAPEAAFSDAWLPETEDFFVRKQRVSLKGLLT